MLATVVSDCELFFLSIEIALIKRTMTLNKSILFLIKIDFLLCAANLQYNLKVIDYQCVNFLNYIKNEMFLDYLC